MAPYFLLLPAIASMVWALITKYHQRKIADLLLLSLTGTGVLVNACFVYEMMVAEIGEYWHLVQMTICSALVPLIYTYFARQVGRQTPDHTALVLLWSMGLITFVPEIVISNPFEPFVYPATGFHPFVVYVLSGGEKLYAICTGDLAVILQCLVVVVRILSFMRTLRQHNLHFSGNVRAFGAVWALAIVFIVMLSTMTYDDLRSTLGMWFYFAVYSLLLIQVNVLIALRYDLYPIETEGGEVVENVAFYVQRQFGTMASQLRQMMEADQLFRDPQLTADHVTEELHTNHTYLSQMMSSEWGMSFSEYLNTLRMTYAEELLHDDSLTITQVAQQSGFSDAGYMARKFKIKYGVTPSEWRKRR